MPWQSDVVTNAVISSNKIRFQVTIPNTNGQSFSESENNYIQWKAINSGGYELPSSKYQIKVISNDVPVINITQPDEKGGVSGEMPLIQAVISDRYAGIDENSIQIKLDKVSGESVASLTSTQRPDIFTASKNLISYKYDQASLVPENSYKLTVSASDKGGLSGSSSIIFTVKGGAIADLVPYPSPFDPAVQPVTLRYVLNKRSEVSVNMYDMSGKLVKTIINSQTKEPGISEEQWLGDNYAGDILANGIYFCEIVAKDEDGEHRRYTSLGIFGK